MKEIYLLTDYKNRFGSKHDDQPYRSGMDHQLLRNALMDEGYLAKFISINSVNLRDEDWKERIVLYTSAEDKGLVYKQYIEDIVFSLELAGARVIPSFKYLRAHNNKVFMELLRDLLPSEQRGNLVSFHFGTAEELTAHIDRIDFPVVVKGHSGAMGRNVFLAHTQPELKRLIRCKIASKTTIRFRLKEILRQYKHQGYIRESFFRGRFIIQTFIPGLKNDWKVYFFGDRAYVFSRPVFKSREFRASGGGYDNYRYGLAAKMPDGLLEFGWGIFRTLDIPFVSMDLAWDGGKFYLLEFQCLYFGTAGILKRYSGEVFMREYGFWRAIGNEGVVERTFARGVSWYLRQQS
jgi:glutathione synthase/RimK-type ligase-like ATP-grasp enzyme